MKVRVTRTPPVEKRHGVEQGTVYEILERHPEDDRGDFHGSVWIMGADGEKVRLLPHEFESVEDE